MHVRAALRNGLTADEIGEVLLHGAIYAGVPAANTPSPSPSACSPRPTPTGDGHPGRDRGGRPGRAAAGPPAAPAGHRVGRARGALAATTSRRACAPACSSRATVDLLDAAGVAERLHREGLVHHGLELRFDGRGHRIDFAELTGGRAITVYGQQEVVKDLIAARLDAGGELRFEVDDVSLHDLESERPAHPLQPRGRRPRAALRRRRRLRRLPRHQPPDDPRRRAARLRARVPVRVARDPGRGGALQRGAHLLPSRPRLRAAQHALAHAHAAVPAVRARRRHRGVARRAHLGGAADAPGHPTAASRSSRARSSRRASRRCAASWPSRCATAGSSSPATRRTSSRPPARRGSTSPPPTCASSATALGAWYARRRRERPRRLLGHLPAPRVARAALLVVDDLDAAPLRRRRPVRAAAAALPAALRRLLARGGHDAGRELRGPRACLTAAGCSARSSRAGACARRRPTWRGFRPCSTSRPRWRARRRRPGSSRPSTPRRSPRRAAPSATTSTRSARRPPRWATRPRRSCARCAPRSATRRPPTCTAAPRARTSSTARRCSSPGARSRRCSTTSAARPRRRRGWPASTARPSWPGARCCSRPCPITSA